MKHLSWIACWLIAGAASSALAEPPSVQQTFEPPPFFPGEPDPSVPAEAAPQAPPSSAAPPPVAGPVAAAPPKPVPVVAAPAHSYGKQIAVGDAAAGVLVLSAGALGLVCFFETFEVFEDEKPDSHPTCTLALFSVSLGLGAYALTGPIIHLVHGRPLAALGSLGLRVALPTAGALIMASGDDEAEGWGALLFVAGAVTAAFIDWLVLAAPGEPAKTREPRAVGWQPAVLALRGGAGLGLVARY